VHLRGIQAELSESKERLVLTWLTETFEKRFKSKPLSFRAGRYGLSSNSIRLLAELGYLVDSSVTPGLLWQYGRAEKKYLCDYRYAPRHPYECSFEDASFPGRSGILEIPIALQRACFSPKELLRLASGRPRRWVWARPGFATRAEISRMVRRAARRGCETDILVMMFHNMEVVPGKSPYCSTKEDVTDHLADIEHFILSAKAYGLTQTTLSEYAKRFGASS
jgi:hypothetical protein